ncbi:MAG: hypothetical protein WDA68_01010 [Phycisphaerae bacterium]
MNKLQKQSWYQLIVAAIGTAAALFLYLKNSPAIAIAALVMTMALTRLDGWFQFLPDKKTDSGLDDKEQSIVLAAYIRSLLWAWRFVGLVLVAACFIFLKQEAVPIGWVFAIWLGGSIIWSVLYSIMILLRYGRGGKENE